VDKGATTAGHLIRLAKPLLNGVVDIPVFFLRPLMYDVVDLIAVHDQCERIAILQVVLKEPATGDVQGAAIRYLLSKDATVIDHSIRVAEPLLNGVLG
jgi:hypothetical protein